MLVKLAAIFFSMILVNNYVLVKFYGICPFLGVSKKLDSSIGMSGAVIFVMLVATAVTFPIQIFVLNPADLGYLQTIVFILVIAVLVQFIEIFLKKYVVALYNSLGVYLPLITTNCCVLAVTILVVDDYGADVATLGFAAAYIEALVCAVGAGVGFTRRRKHYETPRFYEAFRRYRAGRYRSRYGTLGSGCDRTGPDQRRSAHYRRSQDRSYGSGRWQDLCL